MTVRHSTLVIVVLAVLCTAASAEQIRLRTGDMLQGEVLSDRSTESHLSIKLYRTGGVFDINWDQLIPEDQNRLKDQLGYAELEAEDVPRVPGHELLLRDGSRIYGLVTNEDDRSGPVILRTASGVRSYPRDMVAKVTKTMVEAPEIYTVEDLYQKYLEEMAPALAAAAPDEEVEVASSTRVELADTCMAIGAYEKALEHYKAALDDPDLPDEKRLTVQNRIPKAEMYLAAKDATQRVLEAKRKRYQKRYDEALQIIADLNSEYEGNDKMRNLLQLDRLRRQITSDRKEYFTKQVTSRFYRELSDLVRAKVRDKEASMKDVAAWAVNPKGLGQEVFNEITADTGLDDAEARELWEARTTRQTHRFNYGSGTYLHPDEAQKTRKAMAEARKNQRKSDRQRGGMRGGNRGAQQQERQKTADEWWNSQSARNKQDWIKAYFAEFSGLLLVLRIQSNPCSNCGGKGVTYAMDAATGDQIKHICPVCSLAGKERIVICR